MTEELDVEKAVHIALVKCAELFQPDAQGFYEFSDKYRNSLKELYDALLKFDMEYGYEVAE